MSRKKIIAGNWKMNLTVGESQNLAKALHENTYGDDSQTEIVIAPTHLSLYAVVSQLQSLHSTIKVAAQNVHYQNNGAYTGEVSTSMLLNLGISYCIIGHSERRSLFGESDEIVNLKAIKLIETGITPILCVGETLKEREADRWQEVVVRQCDIGFKSLASKQAQKIVIAYEPVWAIGTGVSASPEQAQEVHHFIRKQLQNLVPNPEITTILYGGSVNANNAEELFSQSDIDGGLVGGSSLKADVFTTIIHSLKS